MDRSRQPTVRLTKEEIMADLDDRNAHRNFSELVAAISSVCYKKCIVYPSSTLSSKEQACMDQCVEKYIEIRATVMRGLVEHKQRMAENTLSIQTDDDD